MTTSWLKIFQFYPVNLRRNELTFAGLYTYVVAPVLFFVIYARTIGTSVPIIILQNATSYYGSYYINIMAEKKITKDTLNY